MVEDKYESDVLNDQVLRKGHCQFQVARRFTYDQISNACGSLEYNNRCTSEK